MGYWWSNGIYKTWKIITFMYPHQWGKHGVNITNNISWKYPITNVSMLSHCYPITTRWCPRSRTLSWWTQLQFHYGFCWWYKSIVHGLISPIYYWGGTNLCPISIIFHHHAISLSHENIPWISIMVIPSLSHHYPIIILIYCFQLIIIPFHHPI